MGRRRSRRAAVAAALALGLLAPASQAGACPDPDEEPLVLLYADTLTVTLRAARKTYRPGETARVTVTVERHGPAGTSAEPVAAQVKGRLRTPKGVEPYRFAFTLPASGTRTKLWAIPRGTRPGPLAIDATALYELLPSASCYSSLAYERGTAASEAFLTIRR
ncbi:MAG TPA: hypothetical protein VNQ77_16170 [Frankiaceae bacterium]|nr:hypothetical protein [Frankiaceae bacterium]